MYDDINDLFDSINERIERVLREQFDAVSAEQLGLDRRAGYRLYVNADYIAAEGDGHMLDYYGGFEYVDSEAVRVYGDYKFYSSDDERVREHIARYYDEQQAEEEEA